MDWLSRLNKAIDYIEENLEDNLNIEDIADQAYASPYHFAKMFFAILGVSPAEYIRRRRLTLAAKDLMSQDTKVIDVALKYGYESPNAFTRAFRNMHGVNPKDIHNSGVSISTFNRLTFDIKITGGTQMEYKIVERPAFKIVGKSKKYKLDEFLKDGGKYWKEYIQSDEYKKLWGITQGRCGTISQAPMMSIYLPQNGSQESFINILGIEVDDGVDTLGFESFEIPAATYAEFDATLKTSMKVNRYIYSEWFASTGYERDSSKPDIESYYPMAFGSPQSSATRWWIPIVKK